MKKRNLFILPLVMVGMLAAVSCGGGDDGSGEVTPYVPDDKDDVYVGEDPLIGKTVTIRFDSQWGGNMQALFNSWKREFEQLHPGITVEVNKISGDYSDVSKQEVSDIQVGAGGWGDIVSCYPDHCVRYSDLGVAVDLNNFIYNENEAIAYQPSLLNDLTPAAKSYMEINYPRTGMFCAPFAVSTEYMVYNAELLEWTIDGVNGGKRITEDYLKNLTWEEFFNVFCPAFMKENAKKPDSEKLLLSNNGDNYAILGYDDDANAFITLLEQKGTPFTHVDDDGYASLTYDTPEAKQLTKDWNSYRNLHYVITEGSNTNSKPSALLADKKVLFAIASTGGVSYLASSLEASPFSLDVNCTLVPHAEGHEPKMVLQGGSLAILAHPNDPQDADRQLAAWMFYKYITQKSNCLRWAAQTGYVPIKKSCYRNSIWQELINTEGKEGIDYLSAISTYYVQLYNEHTFQTDVFKGSQVARTQVDGLFSEILNATVEECTDAFIEQKFATAISNTKKEM